MTAAERLVLILTADLLVATQTPITLEAHAKLLNRLQEARHALDAEAFWSPMKGT
jgi:hypothetical protein